MRDNYLGMNTKEHFDRYRDQEFQRIIYKLNQEYLRVNQSAFTNFTIMDKPYLTEIFGGRVFPDGSFVLEEIDEIIEYQKAFMEVFSNIRLENMMTFPVVTTSLLFKDNKFVDEEFARWATLHNMKWGDSNFFIDDTVTSLASCCRLRNDFSKLDGFVNSIGGTALKIGSVKVNTINLMRIALESGKNKQKYFEILSERVHLAIKVLDVVRHIIIRNVEKGLLPNYQDGVIDIKNQFNTIGINAMFEVIKYFGLIEEDDFGYLSYTEEGLEFASAILDKINAIKDSYTFDYSINVEAVPGERAAVILCEKDKRLFPEETGDYFIYSNQWIPLLEKCSIEEKIRLGSILDAKCGGGQISHINLDSPIENEEVAWDLMMEMARSKVIYFAYNLRISACAKNHGFYGETCPQCGGEKTDSYQRIVG